MNSRDVSILFANWLSSNYDNDFAVGHWMDYDEYNTVYTTEQLWVKFEKTELRKLKINKLKNEKS